MNKYNAHKVTLDGITFDSLAEYSRYCELKLLERAGEISGLEVHKVFTLQDAFIYQGKKERRITYETDFLYCDDNGLVIEDVKGVQTEAFKLKWKMMKYKYKNVDFRIVR